MSLTEANGGPSSSRGGGRRCRLSTHHVNAVCNGLEDDPHLGLSNMDSNP